jgi:transposase
MSKPVEVSRVEHSAAELRALAASTRDGRVVRRLLAIALVLEGESRAEAARLNGMDRKTLRDWVHRYNEAGVDGLRPRVIPGRPNALTDEQMEELRTMVLKGPDSERDGVVRWRCVDLRDAIAARWSVTLHEHSVGRLLHRLETTRLQPRPFHPMKDAAAEFKKIPTPDCGSDRRRPASQSKSDFQTKPGSARTGAL